MSNRKNYAPTGKKLREARRRGEVVKSRLLTGSLVIISLLPLLTGAVNSLPFLSKIFIIPLEHGEDFLTNNMVVSVRTVVILALRVVAPIIGAILITAVAGEVMQVGINFCWSAVLPRWSRLSPIEGMRRMLGWRGDPHSGPPIGTVCELSWMIVGLIACGGVIASITTTFVNGLDPDGFVPVGIVSDGTLLYGKDGSGPDLGPEPPLLRGDLRRPAIRLVSLLSLAGFCAGGGEWLILRRRHHRRLMMDLQELKRELRESEGDPELRGMRKHLHQELLQHETLERVRRAHVVIVDGPG